MVVGWCLWWALGWLLLLTSALACVVWENDDPSLWPRDVAVVLHSCDAYVRYWEGMLHQWQRYTRHLQPYPTVVWATETVQPEHVPPGVTVVFTGPGTWARRLKSVLRGLREPYILYLQEDAWLTAPLRASYIRDLWRVIQTQGWHALKLSAGCQHQPATALNDVNNPLWYAVSHQPSLWHKDFLLSTLYDEQEAMAHELETNAMLHQHPALAATCRCAQDVTSVVFPFVEVSRQGRMLPAGWDLLKNVLWTEQ